ncbi:unnamed protein product [Lampetra fluviatilis]
MSRSDKRRRLTSAVQFREEEDVGEGLATTPGAGAPENRPMELARLELEGTAAAGLSHHRRMRGGPSCGSWSCSSTRWASSSSR